MQDGWVVWGVLFSPLTSAERDLIAKEGSVFVGLPCSRK
jgi:hypothetical protein